MVVKQFSSAPPLRKEKAYPAATKALRQHISKVFCALVLTYQSHVLAVQTMVKISKNDHRTIFSGGRTLNKKGSNAAATNAIKYANFFER
jgi:hypothetical protein